MTAFVEEQQDRIAVSEEQAASGSRSLRVVDAPGLLFPYDPHFAYSPMHESGVTTLSMDLWLDDVTDLLIDWRDWRFQPYEVGPTLGIREGRAWMGSSLLTSVPSHQWISVRMHTGLGAQYTGQWLLSLKLSGEAEQIRSSTSRGSAATPASEARHTPNSASASLPAR